MLKHTRFVGLGSITISIVVIVMKKYQISVLTAIIIMLCQSIALAQAVTVGNMILNKGGVKLRRNQIDTLYQTAGEIIPVRNLDEIQTGKDSSVTIKLNAKSDELELYSQSFFKIDNVTAQSSQLSMSIGKARFKIQKRRKPLKPRKRRKKRFRVRTANAIVGVKGTEFVLAAGTDVTSVLTLEGVVDVASVATPEIEVEVKENQASQIKLSSTPTAPVTVPASVRENIVNTDAPNVFNNVQFGEAVPDTSVKPETKKKSSPAEKKEEAKSGSQGKSPRAGQTGTPGLVSPGAGGADVFETGNSDSEGIGGDDAINLENLDSAEIDDIDFEEPEIDIEDIFDPDDIIEGLIDTIDDLGEEIEEIQEEVVTDQLQEIEIKIKHQ